MWQFLSNSFKTVFFIFLVHSSVVYAEECTDLDLSVTPDQIVCLERKEKSLDEKLLGLLEYKQTLDYLNTKVHNACVLKNNDFEGTSKHVLEGLCRYGMKYEYLVQLRMNN